MFWSYKQKEFNVLTVYKTDTISLPKKQNYYLSCVDSHCLYEKGKSSENFESQILKYLV